MKKDDSYADEMRGLNEFDRGHTLFSLPVSQQK